jgi:hypothetical protein
MGVARRISLMRLVWRKWFVDTSIVAHYRGACQAVDPPGASGEVRTHRELLSFSAWDATEPADSPPAPTHLHVNVELSADLRGGVLRLHLPKTEAVKLPRIAVNAQ